MLYAAYAIIILLLLVWGSFLNVLGYRLVHEQSIVWPRSRCPHCRTTLRWYELIPVLSWLMLCGRCRTCRHTISWLYPCIELLTVIIGLLIFHLIPLQYVAAYALFSSALIATIRSDIETMLISSLITLYIVPIGMLLSWYGYLPISLWQSACGALLGYGIIWSIARLFFVLTKKQGMGEGDAELMALIGAFLGPVGVAVSLMLASWSGSIIGIGYMMASSKRSSIKLPFGPFLSLGAFFWMFWQAPIAHALHCWINR